MPKARSLVAAFLLTAISSQAMAVDGRAVGNEFGPQANLIGFQTDGLGTIVRYDIKNSAVVARETLYGGPARYPIFSPDGARVAFFKDTGAISIVATDGGHPTEGLVYTGGLHGLGR
ncbi:MAG: hypothetical protein MUC50_04545 [Myxococcota bacterium]|jgi:hypothetical protein|nr:hypothetical protein [Myxococcota bacterium]